jgi:S-adenosyl-L-methionine hydrolase (adenosine-forming)
MRFISLLTDFGLKDGYAGVLKGVIWGIAPEAQIADITHLIQPQNVLEGALALGRAAPYFPADTVHLAVVDPGVGTPRRPVAARLGEHYFVGPDNGLCSVLLTRAHQAGSPVRFVHLDQPTYWLKEISNVFHGRDIFSPVAAHLANGVPLEALGSPIDDPQLLELPLPQRTARGWRGQVVWVDRFGNLSTNLTGAHLANMEIVVVHIAGREIHGLVKTFGDRQPGELVAMIDSSGALSICMVNGDAAGQLGVLAGEPVEITDGR